METRFEDGQQRLKGGPGVRVSSSKAQTHSCQAWNHLFSSETQFLQKFRDPVADLCLCNLPGIVWSPELVLNYFIIIELKR